MTILSPLLSINTSCDQALQAIRTRLSEAGLSVVQTFNLNSARLGLHDCGCPHHGTDACDCQMIVLLVYGRVAEPSTLILHGNNGQTWISIGDSVTQPGDEQLVGRIQDVLEGIKRETADY